MSADEYPYDEWVRLQPLGTEGQGMPGYDKKYSLVTPVVVAGLGVKYKASSKLTIMFEVSHHFTFTDYLDDVSGTYGSYGEILEARGELAANLSQRIWEYYDVEPFEVPPGTARGDDNASDWYFLLGFSISYNFMDNGHLPPIASRLNTGNDCFQRLERLFCFAGLICMGT